MWHAYELATRHTSHNTHTNTTHAVQADKHTNTARTTHMSSPSRRGKWAAVVAVGGVAGDRRGGSGAAATGSQETPSSELKPNHLQAAKSVNV